MNAFQQFSIITITMTYILIFIGGLVRVAGAGMGCPDWPQCFGQWIPPTNIEQVPLDFRDQFNLVLAWIEYSNRLFGALVGLVITVTSYLAFKYYSNINRIKLSVFVAFIFTLFEGWLGSILVDTVLNPITITLHLLFALIIIMLLIYAAVEAYYIKNPLSEKGSVYPKHLRMVFILFAFLIMIEIILGTEIRGGLEMIREDNPIVESQFLLQMLGPFKYLHTILGFVITAISLYLWNIFVRKSKNPSTIILLSSNGVLGLLILQIFLGEFLVFFNFMPLIQLFHLWFASLILGLLMIQYSAWKQSQNCYV